MKAIATRARILIVDDVPTNIRVLVQALLPDYEVRVATNGLDALAVVASDPPDLILLDVAMPAPDGHEVCRRLKADPESRDIPVIFISGGSEESDELLGLRLGAVDYIVKPFSLPVVQARVATHLELKRCRDLLANQSLIDGMTGIPNRRRFDQFLQQSWKLCLRRSESLAVILIDVDHFKSYNDYYGHQAGDDTLCQIGQALLATKRRPLDLLARYGGEEFVCVLPETNLSGALAVAESMRASVAALAIEHAHPGANCQISVSLGAAACTPGLESKSEELVAMADRALYQAKRTGRDRVCAG